MRMCLLKKYNFGWSAANLLPQGGKRLQQIKQESPCFGWHHLLHGGHLPTTVLLVLWAASHQLMENPLAPGHRPCEQSGRALQEHQGIARTEAPRKGWEGRFQQDHARAHAVPSDGSLAVSAAHKCLQLSFFTQEFAFLCIFQESPSGKQTHWQFPYSCDCARFLVIYLFIIYFCQAEIPQINGVTGRSQPGPGDCSVLAKLGISASGRRKER